MKYENYIVVSQIFQIVRAAIKKGRQYLLSWNTSYFLVKEPTDFQKV